MELPWTLIWAVLALPLGKFLCFDLESVLVDVTAWIVKEVRVYPELRFDNGLINRHVV